MLIVTGVLTVLIGIGLIFLIPRTSYEDKQSRIELGDTIQPPGQLAKLVPVNSDLGFTLNYDNQQFSSYAETTPPESDGKKQVATPYYENDDVRTGRDYNLVRITPLTSIDPSRSAVADPPQLLITANVTEQDLKDAEAKPDYKGLSKLSLFIKLSTEKRLAGKTADDGTTVTIDTSKPTAQTVNDVQYQKVRYTTKNDNYRISNEKYDDCYYTIQNDQPYAACVTNIRPNNVDAAAMTEQVLQSLAFVTPKKEDAAESDKAATATDTKAADTKKPTQAADESDTESDEEQYPLITKKPEYNDNPASLKAIAKNQPSAVRIGTLYCADLSLKLESGDTATKLTDACVGNVASGTIVSKDGYIATTGHAIRYDPKAAINGYINFAANQSDMQERLGRILDYLLRAKIILQSDAEYLKIGAQTGDQEALAKIENIGSVIPDKYITATNDSYTYSVQPMDKPLVIDTSTDSRPSFAYSDSVIAAKFIAANYDVSKSAQETFDAVVPPADIGLLKAEGSFQNASIVGGDSIKANDILNTVGYPALSDSSLIVDKLHNTPIITNAKVEQTYDKEGYRLIQTNSPVLPGMDGGGTFNQNGDLIGFSIYGLSYCPSQQCFANGTIRSTNELMTMLDQQNIQLGPLSDATITWRDGIDQYFKGNYSAAQAAFTTAGNQYGYNQMAVPLAKLAKSKLGSASDTSLANQALGVMIALLIVMVILTIGSAIVFFLQRRRYDMLRVGHYGAVAPTVAPVMSVPQAYPSQQQPAQQPMDQWGQPVAQTYHSPQQPGRPPMQEGAPQQMQQPYVPQQPTTPVQAPPEDPFYRQ